MSLPVFKALKRLAMGDPIFPQQVTIGMRDPQREITVWLHGLGKSGPDAPRNVTNRHVMACVDPLMIGVVFDPSWLVPAEGSASLCLRFVKRRGAKRTLGEVRLAGAGEPWGEDGQRLFRVRELEIESSQRLGSHTFFIARLVHDEQLAAAQKFFYAHGIYQSWRVRNLTSLAIR